MSKRSLRLIIFALVLGGLHLVLLSTGTTYVYKAILHNFPGINDEDLFSYRVVEAGDHFPWAVSRQPIEVPSALITELESLETIALIVIQDGEIRYERYWDGYSSEQRTNAFSVAKSVVSLLCGIALKERHFSSLDQPVGDFLPEFAEGEKAKITIRHLLTMSSGLNWQEAYFLPVSHTTEAYYGSDLRHLISKLEVEKEAGSEFRYKSGDPLILAFVLEKATGMSLSDYASEKLWTPIEARYPATWSLDREDGMEKAYCCFNTNARDLARLGQLVLQGGVWNGKQLLSQDYIRQLQQANQIPNINGRKVDYYGYLWWMLADLPYKVPYARGILGQYVILLPHKNTVIVRLGHERGSAQGAHYKETYSLVQGLEPLL